MRRLSLRRMLVSAAALAGCSAESIQAPSPSAGTALLDRDGTRATRTYTYSTIEYPGATTTIAWGINARGDVVGEYFDAAGGRHGFLLRKSVFTSIDYPGALTSARGINSRGEIVGVYRKPSEPPLNAHGFLLTRRGKFVNVDFPGHTSTIPQRILADGTILGCRHDHDTMESMKGIIMRGRRHSEIDAFASMHNGATPDRRRIVGLWTNMMAEGGPRGEGYIIDDGEFTSFVVPGSNSTAAWDVNPAGDVVGVYRTGAGTALDPFVVHGFVRSDDGRDRDDESEDDDGSDNVRGVRYQSIDVPGAASTRAQGINARGDIVGSYVKAGKTFGFLARRNR
jgi:uncharacterized membrane protein